MAKGDTVDKMLSLTLLLFIGELATVYGQFIGPSMLSLADAELAQDESETQFREQFADFSPTVQEPQQGFTTTDAPVFISSTGAPGVPGFTGLPEFTGLPGATGQRDPQVTPVFFPVRTSSAPEVCVYDDDNAAPCSSQFREADGRCTNTQSPRKTWGMARSPYSRVLPSNYEDGSQQRRITVFTSNTPLKSPREISTTVTTANILRNFDGVNAHIMQWGQFIAREFTELKLTNSSEACCPDQIFEAANGRPGSRAELAQVRDLVSRNRGDVCQQIEMQDDPVYRQDVCINDVRSAAAPLHDCAPGPREQINVVTHVFDASNIYGSSLEEQIVRRTLTGGKMATRPVNGRGYPFAGGDNRVIRTPNSLYTSFITKHNQIADRLAALNSHWSDERLFQETRRIIAAIQSDIHFYEWLPIVLGNSTIRKYRLESYDGHDSNVNPAIYNELATAAFRFGHSLINGKFFFEKNNGADANFDRTKDYVRGLSRGMPWGADKNFPSPMRDFLFNQMSDIVSLNINRGRDHGLNSYVEYRRHYGLFVPRSFRDLTYTHPLDVVHELRRVYYTVEDIELYIGGVTELPVQGGLIGELFANILGDGFRNSRKGDRFFFESATSGLSQAQIAAIRQYSFAQLTCEAQGLPTIVNKLFFGDGDNGARTVSCASFPQLDLDLWRDPTDTPQPSECYWSTLLATECCYDRRTIYRTCVGRSESCRCSGSSRFTEWCRSPGGYYSCDFSSTTRRTTRQPQQTTQQQPGYP